MEMGKKWLELLIVEQMNKNGETSSFMPGEWSVSNDLVLPNNPAPYFAYR
jgi:hypothetical protein